MDWNEMMNIYDKWEINPKKFDRIDDKKENKMKNIFWKDENDFRYFRYFKCKLFFYFVIFEPFNKCFVMCFFEGTF